MKIPLAHHLKVLLLPPATPLRRAGLNGPSCTSNMFLPMLCAAPPCCLRTDAKLPRPPLPRRPPLPLLPRPLPLPLCPSASASKSSSATAEPALPSPAAAAAAAFSVRGLNDGIAAPSSSESDSLVSLSLPAQSKMPCMAHTSSHTITLSCQLVLPLMPLVQNHNPQHAPLPSNSQDIEYRV